jgi:hypothetical protein
MLSVMNLLHGGGAHLPVNKSEGSLYKILRRRLWRCAHWKLGGRIVQVWQ